MVEIFLDKGPNMNTVNASRWRPKALAEKQEHKDFCGPLNCEENRHMNLEEHKIDFIETETVNHTLNNKCNKTRRPEVHVANSCFERTAKSTSSNGDGHAKSSEVIKAAKRRVTIHMHFQYINTLKEQVGRAIILPDSLEELLKVGGKSHFYQKINLMMNLEAW